MVSFRRKWEPVSAFQTFPIAIPLNKMTESNSFLVKIWFICIFTRNNFTTKILNTRWESIIYFYNGLPVVFILNMFKWYLSLFSFNEICRDKLQCFDIKVTSDDLLFESNILTTLKNKQTKPHTELQM